MGWDPEVTELGVLIVVFQGCGLPYVLRPVPNTSGYHLVGPCFMDGIMDGEAMRDQQIPFREILIR